MNPCLLHQVQIKSQVVHTGDGQPQYLFGLDQMPEISLAVGTTDRTVDPFIKNGKILLPFFIVDIDHPRGSEQHSISSVTGRHYTVEHIDAPIDAFKDIPWRAP